MAHTERTSTKWYRNRETHFKTPISSNKRGHRKYDQTKVKHDHCSSHRLKAKQPANKTTLKYTLSINMSSICVKLPNRRKWKTNKKIGHAFGSAANTSPHNREHHYHKQTQSAHPYTPTPSVTTTTGCVQRAGRIHWRAEKKPYSFIFNITFENKWIFWYIPLRKFFVSFVSIDIVILVYGPISQTVYTSMTKHRCGVK